MMGDLGDAIETCSGHSSRRTCTTTAARPTIISTPGEGSIDWPAALMSLQKIGYDGAWMFEVANTSTPKAVLEKAEQRAATIRGAAGLQLRDSPTTSTSPEHRIGT